MMEQNIKMSKMRERMKKKAETVAGSNTGQNTKQTNKTSTTSDNVKLDDLTANLSSLMAEMNNNTSFIDSILKNQAQQGTPRVNQDSSKRRENNKKKVNRKK
jgi:hypothetical protein